MLVAGAARSGFFLESYAIQIILEAGCGCGAVQAVQLAREWVSLLGRLLVSCPALGLASPAAPSDKHALPLVTLSFVSFCTGSVVRCGLRCASERRHSVCRAGWGTASATRPTPRSAI
jgi:hypothetical protein